MVEQIAFTIGNALAGSGAAATVGSAATATTIAGSTAVALGGGVLAVGGAVAAKQAGIFDAPEIPSAPPVETFEDAKIKREEANRKLLAAEDKKVGRRKLLLTSGGSSGQVASKLGTDGQAGFQRKTLLGAGSDTLGG